MHRLPAQPVPGDPARGRHVDPGEHAEPAEMVLRLLRRQALRRQTEPVPDGLGDLPHGEAFVGDGHPGGPGVTDLQGQAIEPGGVAAVPGGPAIGAVPHIGGHALVPCRLHQRRQEPAGSAVMGDRRQADDRRLQPATGGVPDQGLRRSPAEGLGTVVLRRDAARGQHGDARGGDEGHARTGQGVEHGDHRLLLDLDVFHEPAEVMDEGAVDHRVAGPGPGDERGGIGEVAAMGLNPPGFQGAGPLVRPGDPHHRVPRRLQLLGHGGADEPGRAGQENAHRHLHGADGAGTGATPSARGGDQLP